jgi:hypothetical protein
LLVVLVALVVAIVLLLEKFCSPRVVARIA